MQFLKENQIPFWLFYLISKGEESEILVSAIDNLLITSNVCLYASLPSPHAFFFSSLLSKAYVPSKTLFSIIISEGVSYENLSLGS